MMSDHDQASDILLCSVARRMGEAENERDEEFFKGLLADTLTFRRANGAIVNKKTFLADLLDPAHTYERLKSKDVVAQVYEGVAVVTLLVQAGGTREGKPFDGVFRNIRIFLHEPDKTPQWQLHSWFNERVP